MWSTLTMPGVHAGVERQNNEIIAPALHCFADCLFVLTVVKQGNYWLLTCCFVAVFFNDSAVLYVGLLAHANGRKTWRSKFIKAWVIFPFFRNLSIIIYITRFSTIYWSVPTIFWSYPIDFWFVPIIYWYFPIGYQYNWTNKFWETNKKSWEGTKNNMGIHQKLMGTNQ